MSFIYLRPLFKIAPLIILIFAGLGCAMMETVESTKIPQAEIRQTYVVTATRDRTHVVAYFNHGSWGKSVDLDAPSKIEDNDAELPQSSLTFIRGTVYETNLTGVQTAHRFAYTNNDGKVFRNELSFAPLDLPAGEIVVGRTQETRIPLSRTVGKDEVISIALKSLKTPPAAANSNAAPTNSQDYELLLNNELDESRSVIILKPKNLRKFVGGKAVLNVVVSRDSQLQEQNQAGGTMRWSYGSTLETSVID